MPTLRVRNPSSDAELLNAALFEQAQNRQPGEIPHSMAQNAYFTSMPLSRENQRQADSMDAADEAASARYQDTLDTNRGIDKSNSEARAMGFENPRAQYEDVAMKKLQGVLLPEQMKLRAAEQGADEARTYAGVEHQRDRDARMEVVQAQQDALNQRSGAAIDARTQQFQQLHPPSYVDRMKNFFGMGTKAAAQGAPAAMGSTEEPTVKIQDPQSGEVRDVPRSRAQAIISRGGVLVQ